MSASRLPALRMRWARLRIAACLGTVLLGLAGCGGSEAPVDPRSRIRALSEEGDAFVQAGDMFDAGQRYMRAFHLMAPREDAADARAHLAFRTGRCLSEVARGAERRDWQRGWARSARIWLDEAIALRPTFFQVWFERAVLLESGITGASTDERLAATYQRYLDGVEAGGRAEGVPASEQARFERAQARVAELSAAPPAPPALRPREGDPSQAEPTQAEPTQR